MSTFKVVSDRSLNLKMASGFTAIAQSLPFTCLFVPISPLRKIEGGKLCFCSNGFIDDEPKPNISFKFQPDPRDPFNVMSNFNQFLFD